MLIFLVCIMNLFFVSFVVLMTGVAQATTIAELAAEMEREVPGSLDYLYRWSVMEQAIDVIKLVFDGSRPPHKALDDGKAVAYFTLSTNPDMTDAEFEHHMNRIFKKQNLVSTEWKASTLSALSVPHWFVVELLIRREVGDTLTQATQHMSREVQERNTDIPNLTYTVSVWWLFGLPTAQEMKNHKYPAEEQNGMYIMLPNTKKLVLEHLSITSMKRSFTASRK